MREESVVESGAATEANPVQKNNKAYSSVILRIARRRKESEKRWKGYKKKMPRQAGHFQEDGNDILSRMLLQYHLRKWA